MGRSPQKDNRLGSRSLSSQNFPRFWPIPVSRHKVMGLVAFASHVARLSRSTADLMVLAKDLWDTIGPAIAFLRRIIDIIRDIGFPW